MVGGAVVEQLCDGRMRHHRVQSRIESCHTLRSAGSFQDRQAQPHRRGAHPWSTARLVVAGGAGRGAGSPLPAPHQLRRHRRGHRRRWPERAQRRVCEQMVHLAREVGAAAELRELTAEEVRATCDSPAFRGGAFMRDGASVQPARLVQGLRRVLLERGATIHESTTATRLEPGPPAVAVTPQGAVRAPHSVLALNAWATGWPGLRRRIVAWSSYMVLTAPAPERLQAINWTGGELVSDLRTSVRYFRTTPDGRIAFGGGGGRAGTTIGDSFTRDKRAVVEAAEGFRLLFPTFAEVPIVDAWGGPIDVSPTHLPAFGSIEPHVHYALGYTGNGVAPSHLAGRVLAALITGADTDELRLPMVNARTREFPPQPMRALGAAVVRRAIIAKDTAEEQGRNPSPLAGALARLPRRLGYLLGP